MASELSTFIEKELRTKGIADYDDEDDVEADNPHQSLMGALRVVSRPCKWACASRPMQCMRLHPPPGAPPPIPRLHSRQPSTPRTHIKSYALKI